jgi:hypothetical protein
LARLLAKFKASIFAYGISERFISCDDPRVVMPMLEGSTRAVHRDARMVAPGAPIFSNNHTP